MTESHYARMGVDARKGSVRKVFGELVDNDFPGAFVNIVRDPERPGEVFTSHPDGDGSKFVQRILTYREDGSHPTIFCGAVDDALSMNTGDIAAAGFVSGVMTVTDILNVNGLNVPKQEIMEQVGLRLARLKQFYEVYGFKIYFLGGETADLPHQVQSATFDVNVHARAKEEDLVLGNVQPSDLIWGFASDGQAVWEDKANSGIMSNGLTLARIATMSREYTKKHPDLVMIGGEYEGRFTVGTYVEDLNMTIDEALLSPTRQWAVFIKVLIDTLKKRNLFHLLHGITMNTGSGATKVLHLGKGGILYKKRMPIPPAIFQLVQAESHESWRNMYQGFNCGVGIDIIGNEGLRPTLEDVQEATNVRLYELGVCQHASTAGNAVKLSTPFGEFDY